MAMPKSNQRPNAQSLPAERVENRKKIAEDDVGVEGFGHVTNGGSNGSPNFPADVFSEQHVPATAASFGREKQYCK